ncbi:MAG TPA: M23 family metallopeptidase [Baekduia sp.]|nr:M23 family metallopeptidase [Baekduia sp.]
MTGILTPTWARAAALLAAGIAWTAPAAAEAARSGGVTSASAPVLDSVTCRASCAGLDRVRRGSVVRITGEGLDGAKHVVFLGRRGRRDDVAGAIAARASQSLDVQVPAGARTGRLRVITVEGLRSGQTPAPVRVVRTPAARTPRLQARVVQRRVFIGGDRKAGVAFYVGGSEPAAVAVQVLPRGGAQPVATWTPGIVPAGSVGYVEWDGLAGGAPAPEGAYEFRVVASAGRAGGASAAAEQSSSRTARSGFRLLSHRFPVAGPHSYGEGAGRFGAARGGYAHQGQDVFAACGTPLVATVGGTVKHVASHARAGNYVVISGTDGYDHAYMHLAQPSALKRGDVVATGAPVGAVGDTGRASGCHLHFEMWTGNAWQTGGKPVDPLPFLQAWDG